MFEILRIQAEEKLEQVRNLFREYAESLEFHLDFQDFEGEMKNLPGEYAEPTGCLFLAVHEDQAVGCGALRKIEEGICEMKRLYVKPEFRNLRIGKTLAEVLINKARMLGYAQMRLDTVPSMEKARKLYTTLGFREIGAYRYNPIEGAIFMELDL